jgi:hypothetical protein
VYLPGSFELGRKPVFPVCAHLHETNGQVTRGRQPLVVELDVSKADPT